MMSQCRSITNSILLINYDQHIISVSKIPTVLTLDRQTDRQTHSQNW